MKQSTRREVLALPVPERIKLAQEILESLADDHEPPALTRAQEAELRRRVRAQRRNPQASIPWEAVQAELDAKYK